VRHVDVKDRDVRIESDDLVDTGLSVCRFANHLEVSIGFEKDLEP
jgi:phosphoribosylpyrophosphate synthetase